MANTETASTLSRLVRKALRDAGYAARVTSTPKSHSSRSTVVDQVDDVEAAAAYLEGYLGDLAEVRATPYFVFIAWK